MEKRIVGRAVVKVVVQCANDTLNESTLQGLAVLSVVDHEMHGQRTETSRKQVGGLAKDLGLASMVERDKLNVNF